MGNKGGSTIEQSKTTGEAIMITQQQRYNAVRTGLVSAAKAIFTKSLIREFEQEYERPLELMKVKELSQFYEKFGVNIQNAVQKSGLTLEELLSLDEIYPAEKAFKIECPQSLEIKISHSKE